jgi:DNA-binding beta-propeller fold protein YncE
VLAFDASVLRTDSTVARLAEVAVGPAPVALALIDGGRHLVVTDCNRFSGSSAAGDIRVLDTAAALAHRPAVVTRVDAGGFPRDVVLEPGGDTLLVANYGSRQIQAIDAAQITERR